MGNKATKLAITAFVTVCILFSISTNAQHSLYLDTVQNGVTKGTNVSVSLRTKGFNGIVGIQGSITWDTSTLIYNGITYGTNTSIQLSVNDLNISTNYLAFFWIDPALNPESIPDTSILFTLNFIVKKNVVGYNSVVLSNTPTPVQIADSLSVTPVLLKSFSSYYNAGCANLSWSTVTELNVANYMVQRSVNGTDFVTVKTIPALNKFTSTTYSYSDAISTIGNLYYRLLMVDRNGTFTCSKIVMVKIGTGYTCSLSPNPVNNRLKLHITNDKFENVTLQVVNRLGKVVYQQPAYLCKGATDISLDVTNYSKGSYLVSIRGTYYHQKQFIKL